MFELTSRTAVIGLLLGLFLPLPAAAQDAGVLEWEISGPSTGAEPAAPEERLVGLPKTAPIQPVKGVDPSTVPASGSVGRSALRAWLAGEPMTAPVGLERAAPRPAPAPPAARPLQALAEALEGSARPEADPEATAAAVRAADAGVRDHFDEIRARIERAGLGPEIAARLEAAEARYAERVAPVLDALEAGRAPERSLLGSLATALPAPVLRADALPYRRAGLAPRAPVTEPTITPAYLRADDPAPDGLDYAATEDAPLSPEILGKAAELGYDYVALFEFVRNEIASEVYAGAMKGAEGTLRAGAGNDVDQASLLVALLRASRAAARYVHGVVELDIARAGAPWGLEEPSRVLEALARAGIAHEPVIQGGTVGAVRVEHTWVEAHVPYGNYRGSVVDVSARTWIPLAPALARLEVVDGTAVLGRLAEAEGVDVDTWSEAFVAGQMAAPPSTPGHDALPLERLRELVEAFLGPEGDYDAQLGSRTVVPERLGILPSTLPARVVAITGEGVDLPEDLRPRLRLVAREGPSAADAVVLDTELPLSRLGAGQRLTLSYQPATVDDQRTVLFFGGLANVPAYLVRLRPVVKLAGRVVAVGEPLEMARPHLWQARLSGLHGVVEVERKEVTGNFVALAVGSPGVRRMPAPETDLGDTESLGPELLSQLAQVYGERWDAAEDELAELVGVGLARPVPSVVFAGNALHVETLGDLPASLEWQGVTLDAALRIAEPVARATAGADTGGADPAGAARAWQRLAALEGSALEHAVFEDEFLVQAVSADLGLALAREQGIPVLALEGDDLASILPLLGDHPPEVLQALERGVAPDRRLEIPASPITLEAWTGSAWRLEDLGTGAAGYYLSGSLAGGATVEPPGTWLLDFVEDAFAAAFTAEPNPDPLAGAEIRALPEGDDQEREVGERLPRPLTVRVTDAAGRPVVGAIVHFVVAAGGATLYAEVEDPVTGQTTEVESTTELALRTNALGLASVEMSLGFDTGVNAIYPQRNPTDPHPTRASLHLVDTWVDTYEGPIAIPAYLEALAYPGPVALLETRALPTLSPALFTAPEIWEVEALDAYRNPVSNAPLTFEVVGEQLDPDCLPNSDRSPAVADPATCSFADAIEGLCPGSSVTIPTDLRGARAYLMTGAKQGAAYTYRARTGDGEHALDITLVNPSLQFCDEAEYDPLAYLEIRGELKVGGHRITAARPGQRTADPFEIEVWAWDPGSDLWQPGSMYSLEADPDEAGGFLSPSIVVGNPLFSTYRGYGVAGPAPARHLVPFEVAIPVHFSDEPYHLPFQDVVFWSVDPRVRSISPAVVPLTDESRSAVDLEIAYTVEPVGYRAASRQVLLLRGEGLAAETVGVLDIDALEGDGTITLGKGQLFDREELYAVQLVLNRGTPSEVRSEPVPVPLDQQLIRAYDAALSVSQEVDLPNATTCEVPDLYGFALNGPATVDLVARRIEALGDDSGDDGEPELGPPLYLIDGEPYAEGEHQLEVTTSDLPPGDYRLTLTATAGNLVESRRAAALSQFTSRDALPVGQSLIHGVNPWNGGLTLVREDFSVPGRGVPLRFQRTYSSGSGKSPNGLGPGWTHNWESKVIVTPCGEAIVVGGEGSGMRFRSSPEGTLIAQRGYHGTLLADGESGAFDFYTPAGTHYHYVPAERSEWRLAWVEDPNGNRTSLDYTPSQGGPLLVAVTDASGRRLELRYAYREFPLWKGNALVAVEGPDGLAVSLEYDDDGNLERATREEGAAVESYGYSHVPGLRHEARHLLTSTTNELSGAITGYDFGSLDLGFDGGTHKAGVALSITHPEEGTTAFDYDETSLATRAASAVTLVTDRTGQTSTFTFDSYGSPTSIEDPLGHLTAMEWAEDDVVMTSRTDPRGVLTAYEYDEHGNVTRETVAAETQDAASTVTTYYPPEDFEPPYIKNRPETVTDRNGHVTTFAYDPRGNLLEQSITVALPDGSPQEIRTVHTYAANGDRLTTTAPRGHTTTSAHDPHGYLERVTDPLGLVTESEWSERGLLELRRDPRGHETRHAYDRLGRLVRRELPAVDGVIDTETVAYDDVARIRTETDARGGVTVTRYDLEGRPVHVTNPAGGVMEMAYDPEGRKTLETPFYDAGTPRLEILYTYDAAGRLETRTEPLGRRTTYEHDGAGNRVRETVEDVSPGSDFVPRVTETDHDALNRPTEMRRILGAGWARTVYTYDPEGNLEAETDPEGRVTTHRYDEADRRIVTEEPEGRVTTRMLDPNGNLLREILANPTPDEPTAEQVRAFTYDEASRLVARTDATGHSRSFRYDEAGNLVLEIDARGHRTHHAYDERNRRTSTRVELTLSEDALTSYRYDAEDNLVGETWPNGNVLTHAYDPLQRLTASSDTLGPLVGYGYDARSNRVREIDGEGRATHIFFDALDRPERVEAPEERITRSTFDVAGNLLTRTDPRGHVTRFEYDTLDRRVRVIDPEPFEHQAVTIYDLVGNVLEEIDRRGNTTRFEYDGLNRLVRREEPEVDGVVDAVSFTYDPAGNLLEEVDRRGITTAHTYDAENRRLSTTRDGLRILTSSYDPNGNVDATADANGNTTRFVYDERDLLLEARAPLDANTTHRYDPQGDRVRSVDP
ncbi:MAG: DUF6531 domain-containing protein, partial [Holophagales bacterium]|nr:DUF6531 domain-containing protein [Holophagales bacterium]